MSGDFLLWNFEGHFVKRVSRLATNVPLSILPVTSGYPSPKLVNLVNQHMIAHFNAWKTMDQALAVLSKQSVMPPPPPMMLPPGAPPPSNGKAAPPPGGPPGPPPGPGGPPESPPRERAAPLGQAGATNMPAMPEPPVPPHVS